MQKLTPTNSDRTFKANGVSYKWDLGLAGFDSPTVSIPSRYLIRSAVLIQDQPAQTQ